MAIQEGEVGCARAQVYKSMIETAVRGFSRDCKDENLPGTGQDQRGRVLRNE